MRHHDRRIDALFCGKAQGLDHVLGVAAGRAHDMRGVIMHIIEIHLGAELLIGRPGKEIQAPIAAEDCAGQFDH